MDATVIQTFTSPVVLFFVLGLLAAFGRSDLAIPEAIAKGMSLYLMAAIGLKGGVAVAKSGVSTGVLGALALGSPYQAAMATLIGRAYRLGYDHDVGVLLRREG